MPNERVRELAVTAARQRREQRWSEAIETVERWLALEPQDACGWFVLGVLQTANGALDEAEEAYRRCLRLDSEHPAAEACLLRLDEPEEAAERRRDAAFVLLSEAADEAADGHLADALRRAKAALQAYPEDAAVHAQVGELALANDEPTMARRHLEQALALDPSLPEAAEQFERAALADEPWVEPYVRLTLWRKEAWRLATEDWPAWAVHDALAGLLLALPPVLVAGLPWYAIARGGLTLRGADWWSEAPSLYLLSLVAGLLVGVWLFAVGGALLAGRLVCLAHKVWTGEFDGRLVRHGPALFRHVWRQAALLSCTIGGLWLVSTAGGPLVVLLLFLAPVLAFAVPLVVLGGRDAFLACSESYHSNRGEWALWLGLLVSTALLPALLLVLSVAVPAWFVKQASGLSPVPATAGVATGAVLWIALCAAAWLTWHAGGTAWLVAYRERIGRSGLQQALALAPEMIGLDRQHAQR